MPFAVDGSSELDPFQNFHGLSFAPNVVPRLGVESAIDRLWAMYGRQGISWCFRAKRYERMVLVIFESVLFVQRHKQNIFWGSMLNFKFSVSREKFYCNFICKIWLQQNFQNHVLKILLDLNFTKRIEIINLGQSHYKHWGAAANKSLYIQRYAHFLGFVTNVA